MGSFQREPSTNLSGRTNEVQSLLLGKLPLIFLRTGTVLCVGQKAIGQKQRKHPADVRIAEGLPEREQAAPSLVGKANMKVLL
jgi:hypothetical protein